MALVMKNILHGGVTRNNCEVPMTELEKNYVSYLMKGETFCQGFKLIKDIMIITDKRIILADKQGATGMKERISSINLRSIVNVTMETSGFGFDDSEIVFTYISSPELKGHHVEYASQRLVLPKKYNLQSLYRTLQEFAYDNFNQINGYTTY